MDLDILGVHYRFSGNSARWLGFCSQLWEPFVTERADPAYTVRLDEHGVKVRLVLPGLEPLLLADPWSVANAIKHSVVEHALERAKSVWGIHAAVVARGDACVLLAGASRAGKTSLCLELLERGWSYASDDLAPIVVGAAEVLPFPRAMALRDPDVWDRYSEKWNPPGWLPRPVGPFQLPASLFRLVGSQPIDPTHVFFVNPDHSEAPICNPLSRGLAAVQLSQYVRWLGEPDLETLSKLILKVKPHNLAYRTLHEGAVQVERACSDSKRP